MTDPLDDVLGLVEKLTKVSQADLPSQATHALIKPKANGSN